MWDQPEEEPALVLGAAHKLPAAEEILELSAKALLHSDLRGRLARQHNTNGNKYIELTNGTRYKCEAASDDGGRGLSVTDLAFDELRQQRDFDAWAALTNTTTARFSSQTIAVSNAGTGKSDVLRSLRKQALDRIAEWDEYVRAGVDDVEQFANEHDTTLGLFEWSAPEDCSIHDREGWAMANPSMGHANSAGIVLVTEETLAAKAAMVGVAGGEGIPEHVFRTENLCQWVVAEIEGPFPEGAVDACVDELADFAPDSPLVLSIDTAHNRGMTYLAVAGYTADDVPLVQVIAQRAGTEWVAKTVASGLDFTPDDVIVQGRGAPASSLIEYLAQEGVEVRPCQGPDLTNATSQFYDHVISGTVKLTRQPVLMLAMAEAVKKDLGETWAWNRAKSPVDVAPLCAVTYALWGLKTLDNTPPPATAYGDDYGKWW